jgi:hypothetical protein
VTLQKTGHQHTLAEELGHGLRVRTALGGEAGSLERSQNPSVLPHAHERPLRGEHARHPTRAVATIDPEHPAVKRRDLHHPDAVVLLQMPPQTVDSHWFKHHRPGYVGDARASAPPERNIPNDSCCTPR